MSSFSDTGTLQHWIGEQCGDSKSIISTTLSPSAVMSSAAISYPPVYTTQGKTWLL
jgi:hypothetical protein